MVRPTKVEHGIKVAITIPKNTLEWIDKNVSDGTYFNRSHAVIKLAKDEERRCNLG